MVKLSADAASAPGGATTCPTGKRRSTCAPKIAATPASAPEASTAVAPFPVSSAGWSTTTTSPAAGSLARRWATPTVHAACTSWPQACITPGRCDANGSPVASVIGSASMSPRTATTGADGSRPRKRATTPVSAMRSSAAGRSWPSASYSRCDVSRSSNASSGWRWISSRSATRRRWTSTGTRRSGSNTVNLVCGQRFATDGEVVHPVHVHGDPQPLAIVWYLDRAGPIHRPFRRHDVPFPVAGTRADISRNSEVGKRCEGDVVRAANTTLQHSAAPDRHAVPRAQIVDRERCRETADSARLDIDDASCPEGDHVLRALDARDGFVEADRRRQAPLQCRMPYEIVPGERLFDHQEPELVELHESIAVVERVGIIRVRHQRRRRAERLPHRPDIVDIRARLDLDLHLVIRLRQRLACFRDQRRGRGLDAERNAD